MQPPPHSRARGPADCADDEGCAVRLMLGEPWRDVVVAASRGAAAGVSDSCYSMDTPSKSGCDR
eukprot:1626461-Pyramimonas_sp.AAC.1